MDFFYNIKIYMGNMSSNCYAVFYYMAILYVFKQITVFGYLDSFQFFTVINVSVWVQLGERELNRESLICRIINYNRKLE